MKLGFDDLQPPPSVEDRRGEYDEIQHLLMQTSPQVFPDSARGRIDTGHRDLAKLPDGSWFLDDNPVPPNISMLGVDGGVPELIAMRHAQEAGESLEPWLGPTDTMARRSEEVPAEIPYKDAIKKASDKFPSKGRGK